MTELKPAPCPCGNTPSLCWTIGSYLGPERLMFIACDNGDCKAQLSLGAGYSADEQSAITEWNRIAEAHRERTIGWRAITR